MSRSMYRRSKGAPDDTDIEMGYRDHTRRNSSRPQSYHGPSGSYEALISTLRPEDIPLPPSPAPTCRGRDRRSQSHHSKKRLSHVSTIEGDVPFLPPHMRPQSHHNKKWLSNLATTERDITFLPPERCHQPHHSKKPLLSLQPIEDDITFLPPENYTKPAHRTWPFAQTWHRYSELTQSRRTERPVVSITSRKSHIFLIVGALIITIIAVVIVCLLDQKARQEEADQGA